MSDPKDIDKSLGDERTQMDAPKAPKREDVSLGDRSTFGDAGSSISDLGAGGFSSPEFEQTDLSSRYTIERMLGKGGRSAPR